MPPITRRTDCPQYGISTASVTPVLRCERGGASRRATERQRGSGSARPAWPRNAMNGLRGRGTPSSIDVSEDEVQRRQDRDDVGHVDAAQNPRHDGDVVEAGRADLHPERPEVTLGDDVVT